MQAPTTRSGRLLCQEHDRIAIPEDVPALGIWKGDEGIVCDLQLYNDTVFAFVMIIYSTGQTRVWVIMDVILLGRFSCMTTCSVLPNEGTYPS